MKALVFDSKVVQVEAEEFDVSQALTWVDITDVNPRPKVGWSYNGIVFTPPVLLVIDRSKEALTAEEVATLMVSKSIITRAEFDAIKAAR